MPFDLAACSNNLFHMFISFSVKRLGLYLAFFFICRFLSFQSCLCLLIFHTLTPAHTPRSVKRQRADGHNHERMAVVSGRSSQLLSPGCRSWLFRLPPGPPLPRHSVVRCLTKCPLSPQVSAAHMVGEGNGNTATELSQGPRGSWQKSKLWRALRVNLLPQRKTRD